MTHLIQIGITQNVQVVSMIRIERDAHWRTLFDMEDVVTKLSQYIHVQATCEKCDVFIESFEWPHDELRDFIEQHRGHDVEIFGHK